MLPLSPSVLHLLSAASLVALLGVSGCDQIPPKKKPPKRASKYISVGVIKHNRNNVWSKGFLPAHSSGFQGPHREELRASGA